MRKGERVSPANVSSRSGPHPPSGHVVVNGPPGVGKTTVARALAALLPGTVRIHGDDLRAFAPDDVRRHLGGGSTYRAAAALTTAYLAMGSPRVLFDYVFLRPSHLARFCDALGKDIPVHLFTLWAPLPLLETRERDRVGRERLGGAVAECHREIEENAADLGRFVSTADATPETVARQLHELVTAGTAAMQRVAVATSVE